MGAPSQPASQPAPTCANGDGRPRAIVRRRGKRYRAKLCAECRAEAKAKRVHENEDSSGKAPGASLDVVPANEAEHGTASEQDNNYCNAKRTKHGGAPCTRPAGWGTDHPGIGRCKLHGGNSPTHVHAAAKAQALMHATTMGAPVDIDPYDALLWCVRIAAGEVSYANLQVALLSREDVIGHPRYVKERPLSEGKDGEDPSITVTEISSNPPEVHIWIATRREAIDRLAKFSKMAADAGVQERQVQIAERTGELIGQAIGNILEGLGLSSRQQQLAPSLVRQHLTAIEGTAQEVAQ